MKISTAYFYDRATRNIGDAQLRLSATQAKLASGKQLATPSEAPDQALGVERLRAAAQRQEALSGQLSMVEARLSAEETALSSANGLLIRVKELLLAASNDPYNGDNRGAMAREMELLREELVTLANTRDDRGQYVFAGSAVGAPPFVDDGFGRIVYRGDQTAAWVRSGEQQIVQFNRPGNDAFVRATRTDGQGQPEGVAFFDVLGDAIEAILHGDQDALSRGIVEVDTLLRGNELALVQSGADQKTIENQKAQIEDNTLLLRTLQSDLEDLDYSAAISRMNQEMSALQAAMTSFGKVSQLTLFNMIDV
jgi:flagellar hook-associated protein 3 FlgL